MLSEAEIVDIAKAAAGAVVVHPLKLEVGRSLLYQMTLDNRLRLVPDYEDLQRPKRGYSAFQTDLAVFEQVAEDIEIPRVVLEFKLGLSTHDVITYSTKAERHKKIYPYLRYGLVVAREPTVPGKFHLHNEGLDFCLAAGGYVDDTNRLRAELTRLIDAEIAASRRLEAATFGKTRSRLFRTEVVTEA